MTLSDDGGLTIKLGGGNPIRLLATSDNAFRTEGVDARVVFHETSGKMSHLVFHQGEKQIRAEREPAAS